MQGLLPTYAGHQCVWVAWHSDYYVASCHLKHMPVVSATASGARARVKATPKRSWRCKSKLLPAVATLEGNTAESNAASKVVKVKFMLKRKCEFGQQFNMIGDDPQFGSWDPEKAIPMEWSEGHIWTKELDLSAGTRVEFKIILTGRQGELLWQPGPNRVLQVPEASASMLISESWSGEKISRNSPPVQPTEMTRLASDEVCDALIVSVASFSETVDETADIATQASAVIKSTQDTEGFQTAEKAADLFLISDTELLVKTDPEVSRRKEEG